MSALCAVGRKRRFHLQLCIGWVTPIENLGVLNQKPLPVLISLWSSLKSWKVSQFRGREVPTGMSRFCHDVTLKIYIVLVCNQPRRQGVNDHKKTLRYIITTKIIVVKSKETVKLKHFKCCPIMLVWVWAWLVLNVEKTPTEVRIGYHLPEKLEEFRSVQSVRY